LHGHHRPVQMKKAEIKRRKRVVPNNLMNDDRSSVYTAETAEEERRSIPPSGEAPSPPFSHNPDDKEHVRLAGGPIPVDFTDTFRARKHTADGDSQSLPHNPRKRSFSAAAQDQTSEPYAHAQNMATDNDDNIDPALPAENRAPSNEGSRPGDKDARRAALQAEADQMLRLLQENQRKMQALNEE
jgi:GATA-binding protein